MRVSSFVVQYAVDRSVVDGERVCSRTVVGYGVPGSRIRGEGPWACDGGIGVGRGPRRGWRALPGPTLQGQISSALGLLLLLHPLLTAGSRVRTVLEALARGHYVADTDDRVMGDRGRVVRTVRTRGRCHVRRRTRQSRAWTSSAALVSAPAAARLAVLHQYRNGHASRRTRALQQKRKIVLVNVIGFSLEFLINYFLLFYYYIILISMWNSRDLAIICYFW